MQRQGGQRQQQIEDSNKFAQGQNAQQNNNTDERSSNNIEQQLPRFIKEKNGNKKAYLTDNLNNSSSSSAQGEVSIVPIQKKITLLQNMKIQLLNLIKNVNKSLNSANFLNLGIKVVQIASQIVVKRNQVEQIQKIISKAQNQIINIKHHLESIYQLIKVILTKDQKLISQSQQFKSIIHLVKKSDLSSFEKKSTLEQSLLKNEISMIPLSQNSQKSQSFHLNEYISPSQRQYQKQKGEQKKKINLDSFSNKSKFNQQKYFPKQTELTNNQSIMHTEKLKPAQLQQTKKQIIIQQTLKINQKDASNSQLALNKKKQQQKSTQCQTKTTIKSQENKGKLECQTKINENQHDHLSQYDRPQQKGCFDIFKSYAKKLPCFSKRNQIKNIRSQRICSFNESQIESKAYRIPSLHKIDLRKHCMHRIPQIDCINRIPQIKDDEIYQAQTSQIEETAHSIPCIAQIEYRERLRQLQNLQIFKHQNEWNIYVSFLMS